MSISLHVYSADPPLQRGLIQSSCIDPPLPRDLHWELALVRDATQEIDPNGAVD